MISAIVLTKNEEKKIRSCLKSIQWVDEIILVDSCSDDATAEIAEEMNAKVFKRPFTNFSDQRNFAIEQCSGDWIFYLDADEILSEGFEAEMRAIDKNDTALWAYRVDRLEYFMGDFIYYGGFGLGQHNHHLRVWRNGSLRFVGDVHEKIQTPVQTGRLKSYIFHYSNEGDVTGFLVKLNKYTSMEVVDSYGFHSRNCTLIWGPLKRLIARYFLWGGYKDGLRGLIFMGLHFFYDFISCAKKYELKISPSKDAH